VAVIRNWESDPVDEAKLSEFWERVQKLADKEFGTDDEGDSSVEVMLVDRTRCQHLSFQPVPYGHRDGMADMALEKAMFNMAVATGTANTEWQLFTHRKYIARREAKGKTDEGA
jgi:hypothetical protein